MHQRCDIGTEVYIGSLRLVLDGKACKPIPLETNACDVSLAGTSGFDRTGLPDARVLVRSTMCRDRSNGGMHVPRVKSNVWFFLNSVRVGSLRVLPARKGMLIVLQAGEH